MFLTSSLHLWSEESDDRYSLGFTHPLILEIDSCGLSILQHLQLTRTGGTTPLFLPTPPSRRPFAGLIQVPLRCKLFFTPRVVFCLLNKLIQRVPELAQGKAQLEAGGR